MAKVSDSVLGNISGKIGPVVVYTRKGESIVREHVIPKDPQTPAQLAQRMKLTLANSGLKPLKNHINVGYKGTDITYRKLVGVAMREYIVGDYPNLCIDYSRVIVSKGKMKLPMYASAELENKTNSVNISWDTQIPSNSKQGKANDLVVVVCFNEKLLESCTASKSAKREEGFVSVDLPKYWKTDDVHFWLYLTSNFAQNRSDSLYIKI